MVTVYQRCVALDCPDFVTSAVAGDFMATHIRQAGLQQHCRRIGQEEPHGYFMVWAYPDDYQELIDNSIKQAKAYILKKITKGEVLPQFAVRPKRKRISRAE